MDAILPGSAVRDMTLLSPTSKTCLTAHEEGSPLEIYCIYFQLFFVGRSPAPLLLTHRPVVARKQDHQGPFRVIKVCDCVPSVLGLWLARGLGILGLWWRG